MNKPLLKIFCFLLATVLIAGQFQPGFALEINKIQDKLAPPLMCDDLVGIQHKDIGRIKFALEARLKSFFRANSKKEKSLNFESYRRWFSRFHTIDQPECYSYREDTFFYPAEIQLFFHETTLVKEGICIMCRVKDKYGTRTYFAVVSLKIDEEKGVPIKGVYTNEEYEKFNRLTADLPGRQPEDEKAIVRYIQHEKNMDAAIRYAHQNGLAAEPAGGFIDQKTVINKMLEALKMDITTPDGLLPLNDRKLLLVKMTPEIQQRMRTVKIVDAEGKEHDVKYNAHSSNNAVHIFASEDAFEVLTQPERPAQAEEATKKSSDAVAGIIDEVKATLAHEIGVMLGYPVLGITQGKPYNAIDQRWEKLSKSEDIGGRMDGAVVNLDTNLLTRDYASGAESPALKAQVIAYSALIERSSSGEDERALRSRLIEIAATNPETELRALIYAALYRKYEQGSTAWEPDFGEQLKIIAEENTSSEAEAIACGALVEREGTKSDKYTTRLIEIAKTSQETAVQAIAYTSLDKKYIYGIKGAPDFDGELRNLAEKSPSSEARAIACARLLERGGVDGILYTRKAVSITKTTTNIVEQAMAYGALYKTHKYGLMMEPDFGVQLRAIIAGTDPITVSKEIKEMIVLSNNAGKEIPTHPNTRYTLLMTSEFFAGGELENHKNRYADRFNLDSISAKTHEQFVDKILARARGIENRTIALVSDELPEEQLKRLTDSGIRFIRTNTGALLEARAEKAKNRQSFQQNTYVMMLLARCIDKNTPEDSSIYELLKFYLKLHFHLDNISSKDYITAIVNSNVSLLVKGLLSYRPIVEHELPDYDKVAATLIAA